MFKQLLSFSVGPFLGAFISILSVPIITRLIPPTDYGLLNLFISLFNFLIIFIKFPDYAYAKYYHKFHKKKIENYLLWNTIIISLIISIIILLIIIFIPNNLLEDVFGTSDSKILFYFLSILLFFSAFDRFSQISIRMEGRGLAFSFINVENKILILVLTVLFVLLFPNLMIAPILAFGLSQILTSVNSFYLSRNSWSLKKIKVNKTLIKSLFVFSVPIMPSTLIMWGLSSLSIILLNSYSNLHEVGIYSGAQRITSILTIIQTAFMSFWMPLAFKMGNEKADSKKFTKVNEAVLGVMVAIFILVLLFKDIIILFLGSEYNGAIQLIPYTLFFPIMFTLSEAIGVGFAIKNKVYLNLISASISFVIFVVFSLWLIPIWGGLGAAISSAIAYITLFWIKVVLSVKYWYKFSLNVYVSNTILLIFVSTLNTSIKANIIYFINILALGVCFYLNWKTDYTRQIIEYCRNKNFIR